MGTLFIENYLIAEEAEQQAASREVVCKPAQPFIDRPQITPRAVTTTMIVCGNCGGDEPLPVKTFLTKAGCCANCGGKSYVLASQLYIHILASKLSQRRQTV
jgi:hypothetical protein